MNNIQIVDESGDKKYFTLIPNYILNHSSHWDREVYIQMKRIAGENGTCWTSQTRLAKQCGFSVNRLKQSLKYLLDHQWIEKIGTKPVYSTGGEQSVNEYKIIDLWELNTKFYQEKTKQGVSPNDTPLSKGVSRNEQRGITDKAKGVSPESYKEEPFKQEPIKKKDIFSDFGENFTTAFEGFKEMRKKLRKPLTGRAEEMVLKKLSEFDEFTGIKMLDEATEKCWLTVYPSKDLKPFEITDLHYLLEKFKTKQQKLGKWNLKQQPEFGDYGQLGKLEEAIGLVLVFGYEESEILKKAIADKELHKFLK